MTFRDLTAARTGSGVPPDPAGIAEGVPVRSLSPTTLLDVCERGQRATPAERAQLLLSAGCPDEPPEVLERLSIGRRDARLLEVRVRTFGDRLDAVATCPACGDRLEMELRAPDLSAQAAATVGDEQDDGAARLLSVDQDGYTVRFRLPTGADMTEVCALPESGPEVLLARCVVDVRRGDEKLEIDGLPEAVAAAVAERMEKADPGPGAALDLACPACEHRWESPLDIASYFWAEVEAWAHRTLRDVHDLASTYGWTERDILAMGGWRRQRYLDLIRK
ncbi:MAG: phage baseplate protein [Gemmatimonadota bacterium]|jgi:hypothetical protein